MGEYAKYNGHSVKIGTCEDMYYLRYDQRYLVDREPNSLDPSDEKIIGEIRFRFPFPDEDHNKPGNFDDYNYPHTGGVILSTPCPESKEGKASGLKFAYNGFSGKVAIVQQRRIEKELWTICECGACGAKFRLPPEEAEAIAVIFRSEADRDSSDARSKTWHVIADRILAGYSLAAAKA